MVISGGALRNMISLKPDTIGCLPTVRNIALVTHWHQSPAAETVTLNVGGKIDTKIANNCQCRVNFAYENVFK